MPGSPFNPATGQRAPLGPEARPGTTLAIFQVVAEDTHDNYVECRGYEAQSDPDSMFLHDPYTHPTTTPISVAKPYGSRGRFTYVVGQMVVAARIRTNLGENQGVAATTVGHPADLDEEVEILLDDNGVSVAWIDIAGAAPEPIRFGVVTPADLAQGHSANVREFELNANDVRQYTGRQYDVWDVKLNDGESIPSGTIVSFVRIPNGHYIWETALCNASDNLANILPPP